MASISLFQTPFPQTETRPSDDSAPDGWVAVPVTGREVTALERLGIEDFVNPSTGQARLYFFPPETVGDDWVRDLSSLVDRVVRRDIKTGRVLRESDLLPVGSRPGPTAGLPPGFRAITVDSDQVAGLALLREGDSVDLVECIPLAMDGAVRVSSRPTLNESVGLRKLEGVRQPPQVGGFNWSAEVNVIASDVTLIRRTTETRQEVVTVQSDNAVRETVTDAGIEREGVKQVSEPRVIERTVVLTTLALRPEQVPAVTATLTAGGNLFAAAHSGDSSTVETEQSVPGAEANVHRVEHIRGTGRTTEYWLGNR